MTLPIHNCVLPKACDAQLDAFAHCKNQFVTTVSLNIRNMGKQKNILDLLLAAIRVIRTSGRDIDSGVGVIPQ